VTDYDTLSGWESVGKTFDDHKEVTGLIHHEQHLYITSPSQNGISIYNLKSSKSVQRKDISHSRAAAIDLDLKTHLLYIGNNKSITQFNLKTLAIASSWQVPGISVIYTRSCIKLDEDKICITSAGCQQVMICNKMNGEVLNKFGKENSGKSQGEFSLPFGITVNNKNLFVCDHNNHRVQILEKISGKFITQYGSGMESVEKGNFTFPRGVYYDLLDRICYVGDRYSVQLFIKTDETNECIERIGDTEVGGRMNQFKYVNGICRVNDCIHC